MNENIIKIFLQSNFNHFKFKQIKNIFFKEYSTFFNQQKKDYESFVNIDSEILLKFIEDFKKNHLDKEPIINQNTLNSIFSKLLDSKTKTNSKEIVLPNLNNLYTNIIESNNLNIDITKYKKTKISKNNRIRKLFKWK